MVGAFHNHYSRVLNCLSDTNQIGTFRISVFHKHAGTEVHNIQIMLFQSIYQTVYSPSRTAPARKKGDYLRFFIVSLKVRLSIVESFKAAHSWAGFRDYVTTDDSYRCRICFFCHITQTILCSPVLQQACGFSLSWDFNNKHSENSISGIQKAVRNFCRTLN